MTPLLWITGLSVVCASAAIAAGLPAREVLWGMAGPVGAAIVTWVFLRRTFITAPERVMNVMLKLFAGKVLFFGAYAIAVMRGLGLSAMPFAFSFAAFFVGVHVVEALFLQRLVTGTR